MNGIPRRARPARSGPVRQPLSRRLAGLLPVLLALLPAACGKSTAPAPVSHSAPAPHDVRAYQQGDELLISWALPEQSKSAKLGGLTGFILSIDDLRYDCLSCEPLRMREIVLDRKAELVDLEGNRTFYAEKPADVLRVWRVRVAYRFGDGWSLPSRPELVRGLVPIPKPAFRAELAEKLPSPAEAPGVGAEVNLIWEPVLERKVLVMVAGEPPVERALTYGANLYRRVQGQPWPRFPINHGPLPGPASRDRIPREAVNLNAGRFEYALRWVTQSGAEGPLSEPIAMNVPLGAR
jgi:hypothetical protein